MKIYLYDERKKDSIGYYSNLGESSKPHEIIIGIFYLTFVVAECLEPMPKNLEQRVFFCSNDFGRLKK